MRKTKMLILITTMVAAAATTVYAKLPFDTIIIGNDSFNVNYLFDISHAEEVNSKLLKSMDEGKQTFYVDKKGYIKDIFDTSKTYTEQELRNVLGVDVKYNSNASMNPERYSFLNNEYLLQTSNAKVNLEISSNKIASGGNVIAIKYKEMIKGDELEGNPYKLGISGTDLKCNLNDKNPMMYYFSTAKKLPIVIYDQNDNILAKGQIDFSKLKQGQTIAVSCDLTKKDALTSIEDNSGNSQNSGEVAVADGYIYYSNSADNKKLYSIKADGTENSAINEEMVKSICVKKVQGVTWIYYSNLSDNGKLYKVKNDGTGRTNIGEYKVGNASSSTDESNPYIYFTNLSDNNKIYAINTADDSVEKVCDNSAESINIINKDIYYNNTSDLAKLYKYANGKSEVVEQYKDKNGIKRFIGSNESDFFICTFGGDIYKGNKKIDINIYNKSTNKTKEDKASNINVIGNYIYYNSLNNGGKLYRVSVEGGISEPVLSSFVDNIYVVDSENLYYSRSGKLTKLNVNLDDSGKVKFVSEQLKKQIQNLKILKIDESGLKLDVTDINAKLSDEEKKMPQTVFVTFKDYSTKNVPVSWDLNKASITNNSRVYTGTLVGYGTKVKFVLSMPSITPPIDTTSIVMDSTSEKAAINVSGLNQGDVIRVYSNKEDNKNSAVFIGQGIANTQKIALVSNLAFSKESKYIYITRAEKGKKESERVKLNNNLLTVPEIIDAKDMDNKIVGLDGRDLTIQCKFDEFDKKYVYILPKGKFLDSGNGNLSNAYELTDKELWTKDDSSDKYTGTAKIKTDNFGKVLTTGEYDICIVVEKNTGNNVDKYISNIKTVSLKEES